MVAYFCPLHARQIIYINMQHACNYVNTRPIYFNKQHNYVDMKHTLSRMLT